VVHGNISYADKDGNVLYEQKPDFRNGVIWRKMPFHHPTCFVRRGSYERFGFFDTTYKVAMDYEFMLRLFCKGARFGYIDRKLATMCFQGKSDKNWWIGIQESKKASISLGKNPMMASLTAWERTLKTAMTVAIYKSTGKTLRECCPVFREHRSFIKNIAGALNARFKGGV